MLNRHRAAARAIAALGRPAPTVLDIGCRDRGLARALAASVPEARVVGLDLAGAPDVIAALPGLPFAERTFDAVAVLDVLEHCDDFSAAFEAVLAVAARLLLVSLPNMAHPHFRLRFAFTGRLSDKYELGDGGLHDRHRWLPTVEQSDALMRRLADRHGCRLSIERLTEGRRAALLASVLGRVGVPPSLWAWTSLYVVRR